jgi:hypothetical protein
MKLLSFVSTVVFVLFLGLWWKSDFALPVFCSTRGCVTTKDIEQERTYQTLFATTTNSTPPTEAAIMTTVVRFFLIKNTPVAAVSLQDAQKYREDILHLTDPATIQPIGFSSFTEYDAAVTIPFLQQQSYMNEHGHKTPQEAYTAISQNIQVFSLHPNYSWDNQKGEVVVRE